MVGLRWLRIGLATCLTAVLLSGCAIAAARASGASLLILSPSSIQAGFQIEVRATCSENVNPAFVSSAAFGSITLVPDHGLLAENVTIPSNTRAGVYNVSLACASGQRSTAKLTVLGGGGGGGGGGGKPNNHHGPDTGGGEMAANTGARLALTGGLLALVAGAGLWLVGVRRRSTARG